MAFDTNKKNKVLNALMLVLVVIIVASGICAVLAFNGNLPILSRDANSDSSATSVSALQSQLDEGASEAATDGEDEGLSEGEGSTSTFDGVLQTPQAQGALALEGDASGTSETSDSSGNASSVSGSPASAQGTSGNSGADATAVGSSGVSGALSSSANMLCTIEIRCDSILSHKASLAAGKDAFVPANGLILSTTQVAFAQGETVFDVLKAACAATNIQLEYSYTPVYGSYYVEGINNLYEFDCGSQSGWMYKVNGSYPQYGASSYVLSAGDSIVWTYTVDGQGN